MNALLGVIFHWIGGFASGSFYLPFKKVKDWHWEIYWMVGGLFSWLIVPPLAAYLTIPNFAEIIANGEMAVLLRTYGFGILWGIGGLTYGLGVRYLGMSLGNSVMLGFCSVFGALLPAIFFQFNPMEGKESISDIFHKSGGITILIGIAICVLGIIICGRAGILKEKEMADDQKQASVQEFNIKKGLTAAIVSGVLSACFNFGIETGKPLAEKAVELGCNPLFQNNVSYVVLLWGGLTTNFIWCIGLALKNKSFSDFGKNGVPQVSNWLFSAIAGTMWFLQFFFYGMGESKLGNGPSSWILHMSFIILISNFWGVILKEWKGTSKKTQWTIGTGIAVILISIVFVGLGNTQA
ncbi:L-rhamnose/proton symporter RhaT [Rhizosphaericola mali]|uniref:L-rhamnose/proton symporter RhaT n=1 Tax=Rhizosphaericola mali TaxID=2545455 RepID=A0A5P2G475_9BACT|nr:L-rhamnose/proton symporter RhaT [Rhizosphaericola mali]QES88622.1 L-rhamnose/proton symporter RhaT [Rhizosphaericola mali]